MTVKKTLSMRLAILAMSALALTSCATAPVAPPATEQPAAIEEQQAAPPIRIDIVSTSDTHGWAMPHQDKLPDGTIVENGGLANFGGYLKILRERTPDGVVLVDGGDVFQGTLLSNLFEGISVVEAMNLLGYDSMSVGNHEFDYGPKGIKAIASSPEDDPLGALKAISQAAKFPVLGRNIVVKGTDQHPDAIDKDGFVIVERQGVKIGILGLATPETVSESNPVNLTLLDFKDLVESAIEGVAAMKAAGAEVFVGVFHTGNRCTDLSNPADYSSCDADAKNGIIQVANALPTGLFDALVGGHTHASVGHFVNGMPIVQSQAQARAFGIIELSLDSKTKRPIPEQTRIRSTIPICPLVFEGTQTCNVHKYQEGMKLVPAVFEGKDIVPDAEVAKLVAAYEEKVSEKKAEPLGVTIKAAMHRQYYSECPLGNALSDVLRTYTKADIAVLNSGGIRADLEAGPMTYGILYTILPFDNYTAKIQLNGAELAKMFETLLSSDHGVPQISGLKLTVEMCTDGARVLEARDARNRFIDLSPNSKKLYTLATSDFLASGGDGLSDFLKSLPEGRIDSGASNEKNMRDEFADAIKSYGLKEPGIQGRITLIPCRDASKTVERK